MNVQDLFNIVGIISFTVSACTAIYTVLSARAKAGRGELDQLKHEDDQLRERVSALHSRLSVVEEQLKHLPSATAMLDMTAKLGMLHGDFRELLGEFKAVKHQVGVISDAMMERKVA